MNTLHIVMGAPAAGKTTYAKILAKEKRASLIDIDSATERVVQAGLDLAKQNPNDRDSKAFKDAFREPIYVTLFAIASDNLCHNSVVLVGPFTLEARDPDWLESLKSRFSTSVCVHFITCDPKIRRQRMIERGNPRDLAKLEDWENFIQYYSGDNPPAFPHKDVDTSS